MQLLPSESHTVEIGMPVRLGTQALINLEQRPGAASDAMPTTPQSSFLSSLRATMDGNNSSIVFLGTMRSDFLAARPVRPVVNDKMGMHFVPTFPGQCGGHEYMPSLSGSTGSQLS
jgi:hypothetical protein